MEVMDGNHPTTVETKGGDCSDAGDAKESVDSGGIDGTSSKEKVVRKFDEFIEIPKDAMEKMNRNELKEELQI